jgi:hypothetical protein
MERPLSDIGKDVERWLDREIAQIERDVTRDLSGEPDRRFSGWRTGAGT